MPPTAVTASDAATAASTRNSGTSRNATTCAAKPSVSRPAPARNGQPRSTSTTLRPRPRAPPAPFAAAARRAPSACSTVAVPMHTAAHNAHATPATMGAP